MIRKLMASCAVVALMSGGAITFAQAQSDPAKPAVEENTTAAQDNATTSAPVTELAASEAVLTPTQPTLASVYIGRSVYSSADPESDNIGDINDLIVGEDGAITHAVVGVGGFLGMGEKDVAVPFDELDVVERDGDIRLIYSATREQLEAAPALDRTAFDPIARFQEQQSAAADSAAPDASLAPAPAGDLTAAPADQAAVDTTEAPAPSEDPAAAPITADATNAPAIETPPAEPSADMAAAPDAAAPTEEDVAATAPADATTTPPADPSTDMAAAPDAAAPAQEDVAATAPADATTTPPAEPSTDMAAAPDAAAPAEEDVAATAPADATTTPPAEPSTDMAAAPDAAAPAEEDVAATAPADATTTPPAEPSADMAAAPDATTPPVEDMTAAPAEEDVAATTEAEPATTPPAASGDATFVTASADQVQASDLMGKSVLGPDQQSIGEISDLILEKDGKSRVALIDVGGFLGVGEKTVGIPFDQLQISKAEDGSEQVTVAMSKEQLEQLPAIEIDTAAATDSAAPDMPAAGEQPADQTAAAPAEPVAPEQPADTAQAPATDEMTTGSINQPAVYEPATQDIAASKLIGAVVYGPDDANLGEVSDLVFVKTGDIDAAVIDVGGFLGMGEKPVALEFDGLTFSTDENGAVSVKVSATQEQLDQAPTFEEPAQAAVQ